MREMMSMTVRSGGIVNAVMRQCLSKGRRRSVVRGQEHEAAPLAAVGITRPVLLAAGGRAGSGRHFVRPLHHRL